MVAPSYLNAGTRRNQASGPTSTPALPGSRSNGNLLIAVAGSRASSLHTVTGSGWQLLDRINTGNSWSSSIFWRIVDGTESAPTINLGGDNSFSQILQYNRADQDRLEPFGMLVRNDGTTNPHTTPGFITTRNNSRVIYLDFAANNTAMATPSGWSERVDNGSLSGNTRNVAGDKLVATAGTASGAISVNGAAAAWVQYQIELLEPRQSIIRTYDGSQWVDGNLKMWNGIAWVPAPLKMWDGSQWINAGT
jgi:hypothetical protein